MRLPSSYDPFNPAFWSGIFAFWQLWAFLGSVMAIRIAIAVYKNRRLAQSGINDIDRMTGTMFEHYLVGLFGRLGYGVKHVGQQGDYGADLILDKNGVKTVVQAKRYQKNVGVNAVREAVAAKNMYHCTKAMVVTNSGYTQQARTLARANNVELWDRECLITEMLATRIKVTGLDRAEQSATH